MSKKKEAAKAKNEMKQQWTAVRAKKIMAWHRTAAKWRLAKANGENGGNGYGDERAKKAQRGGIENEENVSVRRRRKHGETAAKAAAKPAARNRRES